MRWLRQTYERCPRPLVQAMQVNFVSGLSFISMPATASRREAFRSPRPATSSPVSPAKGRKTQEALILPKDDLQTVHQCSYDGHCGVSCLLTRCCGGALACARNQARAKRACGSRYYMFEAKRGTTRNAGTARPANVSRFRDQKSVLLYELHARPYRKLVISAPFGCPLAPLEGGKGFAAVPRPQGDPKATFR